MYTVDFYNTFSEQQETILCLDNDDLMGTLEFLHDKDFELISVNQNYMYLGLECFQESLNCEDCHDHNN